MVEGFMARTCHLTSILQTGPGHVAKAENTEGPSGSQPLIAHPIFEVVDSQATISPAP
jgi:hypothetical protein